MKIDWSQNLSHLLWAEDRLQVRFSGIEAKWISVLDDSGNLLGVVIYTRFTVTNCEMSVAAASPKFLSRRALRAFFGYPFNQLGLERVTSLISVDNAKSYKLCRGLGFSVEGCLRKWFSPLDGMVMGLLKEECKWL